MTKMPQMTAAMMLTLLSPQVLAQDDDGLLIDVDVSAALDLVDRGMTMTSRDVSFTSTLLLSKGDFFGGVYAANPTNGTWYEGQMELFAGVSRPLGAWDVMFSAELDSFHGGDYMIGSQSFNGESRWFPEFKATVSRDYGLAYLVAGTSWSSRGRWYHDNDTVYSWVDLEIPVPTLPWFTLISHVGYDVRKDSFAASSKDAFDWSVGISGFIKNYEMTVTYSNSTDDRYDDYLGTIGNSRVVAGLKVYF